MMIIDLLKDLLFPRTCLGCGSWGEYLCPDCLNFLSLVDNQLCPQCTKPSIGGKTHFSCQLQTKKSLAGLTTIFKYKGIVKKAIIELKYRFVTDLAETILELFLSYAGEQKAFTQFVNQKRVVLIPVPLHWQRKNWRGFNQAELLGKMIARHLGIGFWPNLLVRSRNTKPQIKLAKQERYKNIQNAFAINQPFNHLTIEPLNLLLFDDVWTTGATLKECALVLKKQGCLKIWGLTLAR